MEANDVEAQVLSKIYEEIQQRYVGFDGSCAWLGAYQASL